jgi:hypothetical protein
LIPLTPPLFFHFTLPLSLEKRGRRKEKKGEWQKGRGKEENGMKREKNDEMMTNGE